MTVHQTIGGIARYHRATIAAAMPQPEERQPQHHGERVRGIARGVFVESPYYLTPYFYPPPPLFVSVGPGFLRSGAERAGDRRVGAAIAGGIALIAGAGGLAYTLTRSKDVDAELKVERQLKRDIDKEQHTSIGLHPKGRFSQALEASIQGLETKQTRSRVYVALTGGVICAGAAALFGGLFSLPALIIAGAVAGVGLAAIGLFAVVWSLLNPVELPEEHKDAIRDAHAIIQGVAREAGADYESRPL